MSWKLLSKLAGVKPDDPVNALAQIIVEKARAATTPKEAVAAIQTEIKEFTDEPLVKSEPFDKEVTFIRSVEVKVDYQDGSETRKNLSDGIDAIMAIPVGKEAEEIVQYKFNSDVFDDAAITSWLSERKITDFIQEEQKADAPAPIAVDMEALKAAILEEVNKGRTADAAVIKDAITEALRPLGTRLEAIEKLTPGSKQIDDNEPEAKKSTAWIGDKTE